MMLGLVSFTLLFLATWTGTVYSTHGPLQSCCLTLSNKKVLVNSVVDYRTQSTPNCKIAAIVITWSMEQKVGRICADPNDKWTKKVVRKVNENRARENGGQAARASEAPMESSRPRRGRAAPSSLLPRRRNSFKSGRNGRNGRRLRVLPTEATVVEAETVF